MTNSPKNQDTKADGCACLTGEIEGVKDELHEINKTLQLIIREMSVGFDGTIG